MKKLGWGLVALVGAFALGGLALHRGESINAMWIVVAAGCFYAIGYRVYSAWIAAKVLVVDSARITPAIRLNNGRDFTPTNRWIVFGHHFAAIAGPGPLVGPTLAAQFGYLPGTIWILVGAVLGGCVQDMTVLFLSTRRNGCSLGQMAREELGRVGGYAAIVGTLVIMIILVAVLGLVVVNAMKHSPWATATVFATVPIAILVGLYMRNLRPGKVLEGSLLGITLLLLSVAGGGAIDHNETLRTWFDFDSLGLAKWVIVYGFTAAVLPVWLLLAPRDYLSTFLKLGTMSLLAIAVVVMHPDIRMPAVTQFIDGSGPIFGGALFPFAFITIACGAISGFHALVASGTTPKLLTDEGDIRMIGYGSMALESGVAIMALIAATLLQPGVFFAINSPAGAVGATPDAAVATITSWGFPVAAEHMKALAAQMGEATLFARTGGAPSLAVGMASLFGSLLGNGLTAMWYHFAIMFEALFILTTIDAGTRVGRFLVQDLLGLVWRPLGDTRSLAGNVGATALFVAAWGWFLYQGVVDPLGGINSLWPIFGVANQLLAVIALALGTTVLIKMGKARYLWVTLLPLAWLLAVTMTAGWMKIFSADPRLGFLSGANAASSPRQALNAHVDAAVTAVFLILVAVIVLANARVWWLLLAGRRAPALREEPFVAAKPIDQTS